MAWHVTPCADIIILNGAAASSIVPAKDVYDDADCITIYSPATLDAFTFTIQVTRDLPVFPLAGTLNTFDYSGVNWANLNNGNTDVLAPGIASKAITYPKFAATAFRILSSSNVAAQRNFRMSKVANPY